jgi:hypothetical protein
VTGTFRERRRRLGIAGLCLGLLASIVPLLSASPASAADSPTTATVVASVGSQTNVARPTPLTGLHNGDVVTIRVTEASSSDQISSIVAIRQCEGGAPITNPGDLGPTDTGYCIATPFNSGSDAVKTDVVKAQGTDNFIQTTFRVGVGSQDVAFDNGTPQTNHIDCDGTHACSLWIQIGRVAGGGSNDLVHYDLQFLGTPAAPTVAAACTATGATVTLTAPANTGNSPIASYTVSATPTDGGAAVTSQTVPGPTATFTTFTQFKHYDISATATNAGGNTGPASVPAGSTLGVVTCVPGGVITATPGSHQVTLSWSYPDQANASGYEIVIRDHSTADSVQTVPVSGGGTLSTVVTGLTTGDDYFAKFRASYPGGNFSAFSTEAEFSPVPDSLITQTITVRRPAGALVLTQVCTNAGPAVAPTITPGGGPDPLFGDYPYPQDPTTGDSIANYPTDCAINMGPAKLITNGAGAGQFFQATGALNQVTVVDTRDTDPGWTVNGRMGTFTQAIPGAVISGDELGWTPAKTSDTGPVTFSDGSTYDQAVTAGGIVAPNQPNGTGLGSSSGKVLGSAAATDGLGIAVLDGALKLWIPITARTGNYTGVLTITAV